MVTPEPSSGTTTSGWQRLVPLLRATSGTFGINLAGLIVVFALQLVLTHRLTTAGYGAFSYALAWVEVLALVAPLGLDKLLMREAAVLRASGSHAEMRGVVLRSDQITLLVSLALGTLFVLISGGLRGALDASLFPSLWWAMLLLPLRALNHLRHGTLLGLGRAAAGLAPTVLLQPAVLLVLVFLAAEILAGSVTTAAAVGLAICASGGTFGLFHYLSRKALPPEACSETPSFRTRSWIGDSLPMMLIAVMSVVYARADVLMLGSLVGAGAAGVYALTAQVAALVRFGLLAVNPVLASLAASLYAKGDRGELERVAVIGARTVFGVALGATIVFSLAGPWLLSWFGSDFVAGSRALLILSAGFLVAAALGPVETVLMMTGLQRAAAIMGGFATVSNLALNALLIPRFGLEGAAAATAVSSCLWAAGLLVVARRRLGIDLTIFRVTVGP